MASPPEFGLANQPLANDCVPNAESSIFAIRFSNEVRFGRDRNAALHAILRDPFQMVGDRRFSDAESYYATLVTIFEILIDWLGPLLARLSGVIGSRRKLPISGTFSGSNVLEIVLLDS